MRRAYWVALVIGVLICVAAVLITVFVVNRGDNRPGSAGPDVCTAQMVVEFDSDEQARQQQQRLASVAGVTAVSIRTREQVFQAFKAAYEKSGTPELAKLARVEAFYPQVWAVTEGNPEQAAMRTREEFDETIRRIWVTNPCTPSTTMPTF